MKKYLLLLAAFGFFLFSSCSNDDDGGETAETSIVATWELTAISPEIPGWDPMACEDNPTITFEANGTANWTMYNADNECAAVSSSGTWTKNPDNTYTVNVPGVGDLDGTVKFSGANKFDFVTQVPGYPVNVTLTFEK